MNAITELEEFLPSVGQHWETTEPFFLSTSSVFRFSKKLKSLKPIIRELGKKKDGKSFSKSSGFF